MLLREKTTLETHSNPYAYFIGFVKNRGTETVLKYDRQTKQYRVNRFLNWLCVEEFNTNDVFIAKAVFRKWV